MQHNSFYGWYNNENAMITKAIARHIMTTATFQFDPNMIGIGPINTTPPPSNFFSGFLNEYPGFSNEYFS
jgi:hypothetical protein